MTTVEAAQVVRAISGSVRTNPGQFQIHIQITGQSVVSHGGTGLSITAIGGGPGSSTTGQKVAVRPIYDGLVGTWVPGVIISVVGNVLTSALFGKP
jgi:hypothetical protein